MKKLLTKKQLNAFLKKHQDWSLNKKGTELCRTLTFDKYVDGLILIARMVVHAELLQHHPDIVFKRKTLRITLSTHDSKGITKLDTDLATRVDKITAN